VPIHTLKEARELLDITQVQLDQRAGVREGTTWDIESGRNKRPAYETVTRLVRAIQRAGLKGVTAEALFPIPDDVTDESEAVAS
jgi:predicted transcriptional regulator